ncbi:MAG: 6-phosphofructokinase [Oscillospiraceae bacterium]|jgi:6-phosphofructokinase 1|nr:6-phosphofructokinase [Oscillospiraceae bacterium]
MKKRIGILTSGGDCPGLNATIRGVVKACYQLMGDENVEIIGISDGFYGLIRNHCKLMKPSDFYGILTLGGTILGSRRTPYKKMQLVEEDNVDKVAQMKNTYGEWGLDCLLTLGGNGTHKTANLLSEEGLNVIGLPKTIDNDIWGTSVSFGFHTAVDTGTDVIDRIHTTAHSHSRIMVVEIMGNKAGWLTLYTGIAGGADIILIPEIPFNMDRVVEAVSRRANSGKYFSIIAVAEGAMDITEAAMKKKERVQKRAESGEVTVTARVAKRIQEATGYEARTVVPGHMLRGGSPSAYDRVLATKFGARAATLIQKEKFGFTVAMAGDEIAENRLSDVAMKTRFVDAEGMEVVTARNIGVSFGD